MRDVRVLSFHADYRCGRTGRCCTSNWPIPIEADRLAAIQTALATGALKPLARETPEAPLFHWPSPAPSETPALVAAHKHRCVFLGPASNPSCTIQDALGLRALPLACRQFPRISVVDPRGVSVTLSHYCPTAAGLLGRGRSGAIVSSPPAFPPDAEYVGLDASTSLPPLLRPGLLMDWVAWWRVEARAVDLLANGIGTAGDRLARLRAAVDHLVRWTPASGPLTPAVDRAFETAAGAPNSGGCAVDAARRVAAVLTALPVELRALAPVAPKRQQADDAVIGRFLASHAFANWAAHLGQGLGAWLDGIETSYAFIASGYGIADTDLVLRHLADPTTLAHLRVEQRSVRAR